MSKLSTICGAEIIEDRYFGCRSFISDTCHQTWKIFSDLGSTEGYYTCLDMKGKCLPSVYTDACTLPFGVPSVVLVNTNDSATQGIMNKPGNQRSSPADLQGAQRFVRRLACGRQTAAVVLRCSRTCWMELSTKSKGGIMIYLIRSLRRLSSSTLSGFVSTKRVSSTTIRASRSSIMFPMAVDSCGCVRQ